MTSKNRKMKKETKRITKTVSAVYKFNWRDAWYSVLIWALAIAVTGIVILPWYYLALPLVVSWTTVFYFRIADKSLKTGLWVALFWFSAVVLLDILEIIGPYYSNAALYFSDTRNFLKYPIILLFPVIYGLILESRNTKKIISKWSRKAQVKIASSAGVN